MLVQPLYGAIRLYSMLAIKKWELNNIRWKSIENFIILIYLILVLLNDYNSKCDLMMSHHLFTDDNFLSIWYKGH